MNLVDRVKNILLTPKTEWPTIAAESATPQSIYTGYIMILAAIPAIVILLRVGISSGISVYLMTLIGMLLVAFVADALAPTFGGEKNFTQSLKIVAYSYTGVWIAGIFMLLGALGGLIVLVAGIYAWYTFYLGAPSVKKVPAEKAVGYTLVVLVCLFILGIILKLVFWSMIFGGTAGMGSMGLFR